ncbi:hypothetical protein RV14_GL001257 [Enterococcus ratti]|uniref:Uncharacterized protein n=2 Tax=Enterococcus ratti TaxID=150033 RepID=A0A1L8WAQ1_9ENTE|nr:hypothetical protein RV14_GL001257 [Enterococcus ratti]
MTDEPTNFMIFPCAFLVEFSKSDFENSIAHMIGLIVYKKNNNFVVMKVDK